MTPAQVLTVLTAEYLIYALLILVPLFVVVGWVKLSVRVFIAVAVSFFLAAGLKEVFPTVRPFVTEGIVPLVAAPGAAFPSQHTAVASALALAVFFEHKALGTVLVWLALLIGLARVLAHVHYPIDIVGGFVIGIITALFVYRLEVRTS